MHSISISAVSGPATESGSVLISHPMLPQITGADLPITVATTTEVPDAINPGHLIHVAADVELDLPEAADGGFTLRLSHPAGLGAAWLAGSRAGIWPDQEAFAATWALDRRFEPQRDAAWSDERYAAWKDAVRRTLTRS